MLIVVTMPALGKLREHLAQRRVAEPPHRLRGELKLAVGRLEIALPFELTLDLAQRLHVVDCLAAERAPDRLLVDVVKPRARVVLPQRLLEVGQVGELGDRGGRVAEAERVLPAHPLAAALALPVDVGTPRPQRIGQPGHLLRQSGVGERLSHQPGQLVPLLVAERVQQPLGRRHPADQRVDELFQVLRRVWEELAVVAHELIEVLLRVLAPGVSLDHRRQRGHHVPDPPHRLGVRRFHGLLDAAELAVEHLAPQQLLQLLEGGRRRLAAPLVVGKLPDRLGGVGRQRVEFRLAHPGLVARIWEQLGPLLADRRIQHRPGLLEYAVEAAAAAQLTLPLADPAEQII